MEMLHNVSCAPLAQAIGPATIKVNVSNLPLWWRRMTWTSSGTCFCLRWAALFCSATAFLWSFSKVSFSSSFTRFSSCLPREPKFQIITLPSTHGLQACKLPILQGLILLLLNHLWKNTNVACSGLWLQVKIRWPNLLLFQLKAKQRLSKAKSCKHKWIISRQPLAASERTRIASQAPVVSVFVAASFAPCWHRAGLGESPWLDHCFLHTTPSACGSKTSHALIGTEHEWWEWRWDYEHTSASQPAHGAGGRIGHCDPTAIFRLGAWGALLHAFPALRLRRHHLTAALTNSSSRSCHAFNHILSSWSTNSGLLPFQPQQLITTPACSVIDLPPWFRV
jgi:hypothetical protein